MDLKELLEHFNNGETIGEDWAVIEQMCSSMPGASSRIRAGSS